MLIKRFWAFKHLSENKGRRPVDAQTRNLIFRIKNENLLWGVKGIQGELAKLGIVLDLKIVWNILRYFRKAA